MKAQVGGKKRKPYLAQAAWTVLVVLPSLALGAEQLSFKPGFNLFSPQQDVQIGREASTEVEKQLLLVKDAQVERYVNDLGRRLTQVAPNNAGYEWTFKVVNSQDINAFALPGGFIYVNRGVLEAAEDEAQLAGVMAHEIGHVVMRHGTHQASQMMLAQVPLAILGGVLGQSSSLTAQLAELGISFGVNSIFLRYSRSAESQADEVGTYILYRDGYDPHAMAQFFGIIDKRYPQQGLQFISDHPNPGNRVEKVDELIPQLGPAKEGKTGSPEFQVAKKKSLAMPPAPQAKPGAAPAASSPSPPPPPSSRLVKYQGEGFAIAHPDNWEVQKGQEGVTLAPPGGVLTGPQGEWAQAYGASVSQYVPQKKGWGLIDATQQLLDSLRQSNPNLRVVEQTGLNIKGQPALSTLLENDSPLQGQKETDRLVTVRGKDAMLAVILVAPQSAFQAYGPTFDAMVKSLELR
ncbi:MAG: M48 family metallopeptidase [Terriglobia bacterium]